MGKCVRVKWIDYAKGITMLLVIIGHTISDDLIRGMIFSFHMPLFFMLSCVTYRFSLDKGELKAKTRKSFMHLIIPVISIFLICLVYRFLTDMKEWESLAFVPAFLKEQFKTIVFLQWKPELSQKLSRIGSGIGHSVVLRSTILQQNTFRYSAFVS